MIELRLHFILSSLIFFSKGVTSNDIPCEIFKNVPHPIDCTKFYNCDQGIGKLLSCPKGKAFDPLTRGCTLDTKHPICTEGVTPECNEDSLGAVGALKYNPQLFWICHMDLDGITKMNFKQCDNNMVFMDNHCVEENKIKHTLSKEVIFENDQFQNVNACSGGVLLYDDPQCFYYCLGLKFLPFGPMCCKKDYEAISINENREINCCNKADVCYKYLNVKSHNCSQADGLDAEGNQCFYICEGNFSYGPFCCFDGYQLKMDSNYTNVQCCRSNGDCYDFLSFPIDPNNPRCEDEGLLRISTDSRCFYICQGLDRDAIEQCCLDDYYFYQDKQMCCNINSDCYGFGSALL